MTVTRLFGMLVPRGCELNVAIDAAEERCAPGSHGEECTEEDDGVDALATLTRPVGSSVEVEPESELVEGESCADAVAKGKETANENRDWSVASAGFGEGEIAGDEKEEDSPDEVVDVMASHLDVTEGADVMRDGSDEETDGKKGDEEADGGEKETAVRAVGDLLVEDAAEFGEMQNENNCGGAKADEDQKDRRAGDVHRVGLSPLLASVS
jgi:hypothetical protein